MKKVFEDDLISGMQQELRKQANGETPSLVKAADCLCTALEIFEEAGLKKPAHQIHNLLAKIAKSQHQKIATPAPSINTLMEAGITQHDIREFAKGSLIAKAKFNIVLSTLGYANNDIANFIGSSNVMSEQEAKNVLNPNRGFEFTASKNHNQELTSERMIENLKNHGTEFNLSDDSYCDAEMPSFDMDEADDLFNMEMDDSLEVFDADVPIEDFEEERD